MHASYEDIRKRIAEEPLWYDENGCPRYDPFTPDQVADIYASQAALLEIGCQACTWRGFVAMSYSRYDEDAIISLGTAIDARTIHYGDPPRHDDCQAGATMNCIDLRVVEFWDHEFGWHRDREREIVLHD